MTNNLETQSCFGNFNGQLNSCVFCGVAVECYEAGRHGAECEHGGTQDDIEGLEAVQDV